jgi:hypothetical protein
MARTTRTWIRDVTQVAAAAQTPIGVVAAVGIGGVLAGLPLSSIVICALVAGGGVALLCAAAAWLFDVPMSTGMLGLLDESGQLRPLRFSRPAPQPAASARVGRDRVVTRALPAALALAAVAALPVAAAASTQSEGPRAQSAALRGVVYGGRTAQVWPVMIEVDQSRRRVMEAVIGLDLTCTSGASFSESDRWVNMRVNARRKFSARFGPEAEHNPDGTTSDWEGSVTGRFNRARSRISGTWRLRVTDYDTAGAVADTCDSGNLRWTAKQ